MSAEEKDKIKIKRPRRRVYEAPEPPVTKPKKTRAKKPSAPLEKKPVEDTAGLRPKAEGIIKRSAYWSMGIALLPFPVFDMAALTALQIKMAHDISKNYDKPFSRSRGKAIILSLLGSLNIYALSTISFRGLLKFLPGPGYLLGAASAPAFSAATTYALGKVFIQHYEMGGTLLDLDPDKVKDYFREQYQKELKRKPK